MLSASILSGAVLVAAALNCAANAAQSAPAGAERIRLIAVGFQVAEGIDPRDAWLGVAIEETLAWRLRRVPRLIVAPPVRAYQARRELGGEPGAESPNWPRVVELLGVQYYLTGVCGGSPSAVMVKLELARVADSQGRPASVKLGPARLNDVLDQATHWTLEQLSVSDLDARVRAIVFAPPATSPSALEYYAKAISAARAERVRDAARYVRESVEYDKSYRPALTLLARIELGAPRGRSRVTAWLRTLSELARRASDPFDRCAAETAHALFNSLSGAFDAARLRYETALTIARECGDVYGQITALNGLSDLHLSRRPPPGTQLTDEQRRQFRSENLRRAIPWQKAVLDALEGLNDVIAEAPAASKLAFMHPELGHADQALALHQRVLAAARKAGARRSEATAWMFIGQWYHAQKRWPEALDATNRCLAIVSPKTKPKVRIALAGIHQAMSQPEKALAVYEQAYDELEATDELADQFVCLREISELRMKLGRREPAIKALRQALDLAHVLELSSEEQIRAQLRQWQDDAP